jgi:hypothetical protein
MFLVKLWNGWKRYYGKLPILSCHGPGAVQCPIHNTSNGAITPSGCHSERHEVAEEPAPPHPIASPWRSDTAELYGLPFSKTI